MEPSLPPPPPPPIPPNVTPSRVVSEAESSKKVSSRVPMPRRGHGTLGKKVPLLTNHFKVNVKNFDAHFYHYSVAIFYEDGHPVDGKGFGRKVLGCVRATYAAELSANEFAYDGEKSLFTVAPLPGNKLEFNVVLEDTVKSSRKNGDDDVDDGSDQRKRLKRPSRSKTFKVEISFAAKIPMQAIRGALLGQESHNSLEALRVLDIILRQHAASQGCLLVRQSFFHNDASNFADIDGGVLACRGFHSSFRTTRSGLSLNIDVSTTTIVQPGPVLNFLIANQNVRNPNSIDWAKAKRTLKNLRIAITTTNREFKITGLSEKPCREQMFTLKKKNINGGDQTMEVTVYDYFVNHRQIILQISAGLPCINVGKPNKPTYFPIELCELVSLQRYTKALSSQQRSNMVGLSRQNPQQRMKTLRDALEVNNYEDDKMLDSCGVQITRNFTQVEGRVLPTPKLKSAEGDLYVNKGRWNFNNKKFVEPCTIDNWAVVSFSVRCDINRLITDLKKVGEAKGIAVERPRGVFEENLQYDRSPPNVRVAKMFEQMREKLGNQKPRFLLCLLPEAKNSAIYGPWKRRSLCVDGIVTQCMFPNPKRPPNDQYLTNLLLKINAKLGGVSSKLVGEIRSSLPVVSEVPTIILGMDVSHGSPGNDTPSIAALALESGLQSVVTEHLSELKLLLEMIDSLFQPVEDKDHGIMRELLVDFWASSGKRKPEHIIIFRDGVSESQFNQVLNIELNQIIEACKLLDSNWFPKFVVLVAQKNHHTRFFDKKPNSNSAENILPGTIIDDTNVCHPSRYDFYLCAHTGIGTVRPTHYHVLLDEVGFSPDDLQELVHSLSYVYQRSTTAISVVAPISYAHLAASQLGQLIKVDDVASDDGGAVPVPPMPTLNENVCSTMFFC